MLHHLNNSWLNNKKNLRLRLYKRLDKDPVVDHLVAIRPILTQDTDCSVSSILSIFSFIQDLYFLIILGITLVRSR